MSSDSRSIGYPPEKQALLIQANIEDLEKELALQESRTSKIRESIFRYKSALAPIRRLPLETLTTIFTLCLPEGNFVFPSTQYAPLLPSSVCYAWREVMLSTPSLWASLDVTIDLATTEERALRLLELTETWIARSGTYPLSFAFDVDILPGKYSHIIGQPAARILATFFKHIRRWQNVKLNIEVIDLPIPAPHFSVDEGLVAHTLESIEIASPGPLCRILVTPLNRIMATASRLRHFMLSIDDALELHNMLALRPPLPQLTDISIKGFESAACIFDLLQSSSRLKTLYIDVENHFQEADLSALPHTTHKSLQSLHIKTDTDVWGFLDLVTLPSLQQLTLDFDPAYYHMTHAYDGDRVSHPGMLWSQTTFVAFLVRSSCSLDTLSLQRMGLQESDLLGCLEVISPSLQNLNLEDNGKHPATDTLLGRLAFGSSQLCPKLAAITFDSSSSFSSGSLTDMIESRWNNASDELISDKSSRLTEVRGCARPKSVKIAQKPQLTEDVKRLRVLVARGLEVEIS